MLELASYALSVAHPCPQVVGLVDLPQNLISGALGIVAEIFENLDLHVLLRKGLVPIIQLVVGGEFLLLGSCLLGIALGAPAMADC